MDGDESQSTTTNPIEPAAREDIANPATAKFLEGRELSHRRYTSAKISYVWSGILPPPEICREYDKLIPNFTETAFADSRKEGEHRRVLESRGQWMGCSIALFFGTGAFACILTGHDVAGATLGTVDLIGLVGLFVVRLRSGADAANDDSPE